MIGAVLDAMKIALLVLGYWGCRFFDSRNRGTISWVVGVEEVASVLKHLSDAIPGSYSFSLMKNVFYEHEYDGAPKTREGTKLRSLELLFIQPFRLARLANRARGFVYVGRRGFLGLTGGNRSSEFRFLKNRGIALCCYFTGNDIRAPRLLHEFEDQTGFPNVASRMGELSSDYESDTYDAYKRKVAAEADEFADVIFSMGTDQLSYLRRPTEPFLYFMPAERFVSDTEKFQELHPVRILHAPSQPLLKGTPFVREAIERLRAEGYDFDYVELSKVPNHEVHHQLARSHVVLNQFYAFVPGVFGIESMAARCAVLMRADATVETDLPPGANDAWIVTRHDQIFDHLKRLLDDPSQIERVAKAGHEWASQYASTTQSGKRLNSILDAVLEGSYDGPQGWL